jgi:hypothetical protein
MNVISASRADFLETVAKFEGRHLDYNEYYFWKVFWELEALLDAEHRIEISRYFMGSRQISKSTSLSGEIVAGGHQAYHRMVYIAPQSDMTKAFSNMRLGDMLETPVINKNLFSKKSKLIPKLSRDVKFKVKDDVFSKRFVTGSYVNLTYSDGMDTQRLRGLSADTGLVDEAQSYASLSGIHHVLKYCLRSSARPRILNVGTTLGEDEFTSTTENDTLFFLYHVKCTACNKVQDLRSLENIDIINRRIVCRYCGRPLDVHGEGYYTPMNPDARLMGMHANMLQLPSLIDPYTGTWDVIHSVYHDKNKTEGEKKEELLGVPSTGGESLINREILNGCPRVQTSIAELPDILNAIPEDVDNIILGIDWGGDSDPTQRSLPEEYMNSHTAVSFNGITYTPDGARIRMKVLYEHTFPFEDPNKSLDEILEMIKVVGPRLLGVAADFGGGFFPNPRLSDFLYRNYGKDMNFLKIQLLPALTDAITVAEGSNTIKVHKPNLITEYLRKITLNEIFLTGSGDMQCPQFYVGALSQRLHIDRGGRRIWKKRGKVSDDAFMASVFAYTLGLILYERDHELKKNKG